MDPYAVLGVARDVSDIELRRVYRELVKRHHPDHNAGSAESAARFAQIQTAYAMIAQDRRPGQSTQRARPVPPAGTARNPQPPEDPDIESRIARLEREMAAIRDAERRRMEAQAQRAREQLRRTAAGSGAGGQNQDRRPTPEELGYYTTDDSFTKIIDDAAEQLTERLSKSDAKRQFSRRLSELFGRDD